MKLLHLLTLKRVTSLSRGLIISCFVKNAGWGLSVGARVNFKGLRSLTVGRFATIGDDVVIGKNVSIGDHSSIGWASYIDRDVKIGCRVSVSRFVSIISSTHEHSTGARRAGSMKFFGSIIVGDGSWIGTHAIILPQVRKIGACSIVAAGAVVTKEVPENCVVGGNPAKLIKQLAPLL